MSGTSEYIAWNGMRNRCNNPKHTVYRFYGARGIRVCKRWRVFKNFLADMGRKPRSELSLDRINNAKNYTPSNCRWATRSSQNQNRRLNRRNKYGVKGVSFDKRRNRLLVTIGVNGKQKYVGSVKTLDEARKLRRYAERRHWRIAANA